jgi:hypothetical protein
VAERLEIIITATDNASKVLTDIGESSKKAFSTALKVGAAAGGALAVGLGGAIAAALSAEESFAKLNSVIESTGGAAGVTVQEAQALADSLARVTRFSDEEIESVETLLLTFTKIGEETFPLATETVLNMGEAFGSTDGAAIQLGKALNDPIAGVGALAEVGVSFTEEQKNMIEALVETGDIAGAQAVILDELAVEFGGMARAAGDTAAGKLTIFKNRLIDVAQTIGAAFLPFLSRMLDRFIDFVPTIERFAMVFANFIDSMSFGRDMIWESGEALGFLLGNTQAANEFSWQLLQTYYDLADAFTAVKDVLLTFITDTIIPFVRDHLPAFKAALLAVGAVIGGAVVLGGILTLISTLGLLLNPITLLIAGVALLAAAWEEDWLGMRTAITAAWNDHIRPALEEAARWLSILLPIAGEIARRVFEDRIKPALLGLAGFVEFVVMPALQKLIDWFVIAIPMAVEWLVAAWEGVIQPTLATLAQFVTDEVMPALQLLIDFFVFAIPWAVEWLRTAWESVISPVLQALIDFVSGDVMNALGTLALWFSVGFPVVVAAFKAAWDGVGKPVFDAIKEIVDLVGQGIAAIPQAIDSFIAALGRIKMPQALIDIADTIGIIVSGAGAILGIGGTGGGEFGGSQPQPLTGLGAADIGGTQTNPEAFPIQGGASGVSLLQPSQVFQLTINSSAQTEDIINDFQLMQAWAGV